MANIMLYSGPFASYREDQPFFTEVRRLRLLNEEAVPSETAPSLEEFTRCLTEAGATLVTEQEIQLANQVTTEGDN